MKVDIKKEVVKILKEKGLENFFSDNRFRDTREVMNHGMTKNLWLKEYLSLDPLNKAEWIADHIVKFVESKHLK